MSTLITQEQLKQVVKDQSFIKGGQEGRVEGIKYDFCFSGRFLKAKHGQALNIDDIPKTEVESTRVEPGETVFVLTEERLELPADIKAELSHKRKLAHEGVQVLGGFCVDPLYNGRLMFGIYNFSSEAFPLIKGRKLIAAQFYRLSKDEVGKFPQPENPIEDFPRAVTGIIGRFKGVTNQALQQTVEELTMHVRTLREDFDRRGKWFDKTEVFINELRKAISELTVSLKTEKVQRETGQHELTRLVKDFGDKTLKHGKAFAVIYVVGGIVLVVFGSVAAYFIIQGIKANLE